MNIRYHLAILSFLLIPCVLGCHESTSNSVPFGVEPVTINQSNFQKLVLEAETPVVLDFYTTWCAPCKRIAPIIAQFNSKYEKQVLVGKIDAEQNSELSEEYEVMSVPSIFVFYEGKVVDKLDGGVTVAKLESAVAPYLKAADSEASPEPTSPTSSPTNTDEQ